MPKKTDDEFQEELFQNYLKRLTEVGPETAFKEALAAYAAFQLGTALVEMGMSPNDLARLTIAMGRRY